MGFQNFPHVDGSRYGVGARPQRHFAHSSLPLVPSQGWDGHPRSPSPPARPNLPTGSRIRCHGGHGGEGRQIEEQDGGSHDIDQQFGQYPVVPGRTQLVPSDWMSPVSSDANANGTSTDLSLIHI